jgi:hypothetical protein
VTLVADGHTTTDSLALRAEQIVKHHNELLDGFGPEGNEIRVIQGAEVVF